MSQPIQARLRRFTRALLERRGALVDWPDQPSDADGGAEVHDGLALLPPSVAAALRSPETAPLTHRPDGERFCVNLATDFLERIGPLLGQEPFACRLKIPELYLKKSGLQEAVARAFTWHNARLQIGGAMAVRIEYHLWYFAATIESEQPWEQVLRVDLNSESGAPVTLPDPSGIDEMRPHPHAAKAEPLSYPTAARRAGVAMQRAAASFIANLEARLERDRQRLHDYYGALMRETGRPRRGKAIAEPQELESRRRAVQLELRRKLDELLERYAIRAEVSPVALIRLDVPALRVDCAVQRRKAVRTHHVYWNALTKEIEPMACESCGAGVFSLAFTDDRVDAMCAACFAASGNRRPSAVGPSNDRISAPRSGYAVAEVAAEHGQEYAWKDSNLQPPDP